ncbi:MAG: winged helix-turn-helix transcriptional regulator [Gallionella sp.]
MFSYGQFCPLAQAAQVLCERWTLIIVRELMAGSTHFNEIKKGVPLMSPTLLSNRLQRLTQAGVIARTGSKGHYLYRLTIAGQQLRPVVEMLGAWGHRWMPSSLYEGDLDAGLLMWDMRRTVDPAIFSSGLMVVQFEYFDAPRGKRDWWLVSKNGEVDMCLRDPGLAVDVLIKCSLRTMTEVWICQQRFDDAVKNGDIKVTGAATLVGKLQNWLRASGLASLGASQAA